MRSLTKQAMSTVKHMSPKRFGIYNTETKEFKYGISESSEAAAWAALKKRTKQTVPKPCFVVKETLF